MTLTAVNRPWNPDGRAPIETALSHRGRRSRTSIVDLMQALGDPSVLVRYSAAQALGERGTESTPAVGALLRTALRDEDRVVRLQAAIALYKIDGREQMVVPLLVKALRGPDEVCRWMAADCLREIGPAAQAAVPALLDGLRAESRLSLLRCGLELALGWIDPEAAAGTATHHDR